MIGLIVLLCIALVVICIYIAYQFYLVALMKGHKGYKYFILPLFFPLAGYLLVLALPDMNRGDRGNGWNTANGGYVNTTAGTPANTMSDELPDL